MIVGVAGIAFTVTTTVLVVAVLPQVKSVSVIWQEYEPEVVTLIVAVVAPPGLHR